MYNNQYPNVFPVTGNPNSQLQGSAAGARGPNSPPDVAWDGANLWFCTTTGTKTSAIWSKMTTQNLETPTYPLGTITGAVTLDYTKGLVQTATLSGTVNLSILNFPPGYSELALFLTNGGAGTIVFPASVNWITSTGATTNSFSNYGVTLQAAGTNIIVFFSPDGGTTIYGKVVQ